MLINELRSTIHVQSSFMPTRLEFAKGETQQHSLRATLEVPLLPTVDREDVAVELRGMVSPGILPHADLNGDVLM